MKMFFVVALLSACMALPAQETRREVSHATGNPAVDSKPNSPDVPDVFAVSGHLQRIVVLRFKFGADLLAGLEKMIAEQKIKNAVILGAVGSVRGYQLHMVSNRDMPSKILFVKNLTQPADIIGMSGIVMNGRVHPHITLALPDKSIGGHLEPDTTVFTFAIVTLGVLDDSLDMSRFDDSSYR
ncbi:MAG TPA: PPC domain-containing DNA-binding protein [Terracidiphilus sp.]|nr:PPC domain-containing DNA-binding protein [Terracidiphilus sp.]